GAQQADVVGAAGGYLAVELGTEAVNRGVDRVGGHRAVRGVLAAGDHDQPVDRGRHRVFARQFAGGVVVARQQRTQSGVHALHLVVCDRFGQHRVDVAEQIVDIAAAGG